MNNRIAQRLTLYFGIVLLVFAMISGILFSLMFARHTADVAARNLYAHAESIANTLTHFVSNYHEGSCQGGGFKSYTRFVAELAMSDLYLIDSQGIPVTIGEMQISENPLPQDSHALIDHVFRTGTIISESITDGLLRPARLIVGAPVFNSSGNTLYALILHYPIDIVEHTLHDTVFILAACLCIAGILGIIVSGILSHRFVTPLHRMKECTTQLTSGNYDTETGIVQNDEIGVLARHIDALALQLDTAQKERSQLDKMRQDFFSDISHELRTPIAVLKGGVELLRENIISDKQEQQAYCNQLYADVTHIERLVNDLLELTRLQNPHFTIEKEIINLIDILHDSIRFMRPAADKKRISLHFDNQCGPFPVLGDYGRLRQLMIILLDNAIKFSPEDSQVDLSACKTEDGCEVCLTDRGAGIDKASLEHIIDRYFHSRASLNRSGTGLGLPIAKEIALRHEILITCRSVPGEGTCFRLLIPEHALPEESI